MTSGHSPGSIRPITSATKLSSMRILFLSRRGGKFFPIQAAAARAIWSSVKYYYPHAVTRPIRIAIAALALPVALWAAEPASLDPHLEPLRPWLGKTWKEQPKESMSPAKTDITRLERALNGKAVPHPPLDRGRRVWRRDDRNVG